MRSSASVMALLFAQISHEQTSTANSGKKSSSPTSSKGSSTFRRLNGGQDAYVKTAGDDRVLLHDISWPLRIDGDSDSGKDSSAIVLPAGGIVVKNDVE